MVYGIWYMVYGIWYMVYGVYRHLITHHVSNMNDLHLSQTRCIFTYTTYIICLMGNMYKTTHTITRSRASLMRASEMLSSADVASSRIKMEGFYAHMCLHACIEMM